MVKANNYLEKHIITAARYRPVEMHKLGLELFQQEHTKPLFSTDDIFTVHNQFNYLLFILSLRKETLIITPTRQVESFLSWLSSSLWNTYRTLPEGR